MPLAAADGFGHPDLVDVGLALGCTLLGRLLSMLAVLCTQQRCSRVFGQTLPAAFQKPSAPSPMASWGGLQPPPFQVEQQVAPRLRIRGTHR